MQYESPHYRHYVNDFHQIAQQFDLDPEHLKVEFYTPQRQAIFIEEIQDQEYKIHINLEDNRIVSFQRVSPNGNGNSEQIKMKYRRFMK